MTGGEVHKDRVARYQAEYYRKHREKKLERQRSKDYYWKNREKIAQKYAERKAVRSDG